MFEREDGLVLIDQHSAHERVLFEKFMGALERGDTAGQRLLFPLTLHLGPAEADAFEQHRDALEGLGFETERARYLTELASEIFPATIAALTYSISALSGSGAVKVSSLGMFGKWRNEPT